MRYFCQILTLLIIQLFPVHSNGGTIPVVLHDSLSELCIAREYVDFFEDKSGQMTLNEVLKVSPHRFIPSTAQDLINDNLSSAYWLRFRLEDHTSSHKPFRIELFDFDIDEISLYYKQGKKYTEHKAGFKYPFRMREIGHKNVGFAIPAFNPTGQTFYMRFKSDKKNVLEPMVRSYDKTIEYALTEYISFGIFYGLLLLIIIYNLVYFISLRKSYYLYFVLSGLGILMYLTSKNGTGFQYIWPLYPEINHYTGETGLWMATSGILLFTLSFMELDKTSRSSYNIVKLALISRLIIYFLQLTYPDYYLYEFIDLLFTQTVFILSIYLYWSGLPSAKWLLIAYSVLNVSFLLTFLEIASIIPSNVVTVYALNAGIILQYLFLSIGIAETVKETYKEKAEVQEKLIFQYKENDILKEKVNRELEQKVSERTIELNKANEELKLRAEENIKMNIALDLANNELKKYLNHFAITSVTKAHLGFEEFEKAYPDEFSCIKYLRELKEKSGYMCLKCGNDKSIKGKAKFDFRCSKCNYNESLTANTVFHRTKFPLQKAFYMLYMICQKNGNIPAVELAKALDLQSATCQNFKNKITFRLKDIRKSGKNKNISWEDIILDKNTLQFLSSQEYQAPEQSPSLLMKKNA